MTDLFEGLSSLLLTSLLSFVVNTDEVVSCESWNKLIVLVEISILEDFLLQLPLVLEVLKVWIESINGVRWLLRGRQTAYILWLLLFWSGEHNWSGLIEDGFLGTWFFRQILGMVIQITRGMNISLVCILICLSKSLIVFMGDAEMSFLKGISWAMTRFWRARYSSMVLIIHLLEVWVVAHLQRRVILNVHVIRSSWNRLIHKSKLNRAVVFSFNCRLSHLKLLQISSDHLRLARLGPSCILFLRTSRRHRRLDYFWL